MEQGRSGECLSLSTGGEGVIPMKKAVIVCSLLAVVLATMDKAAVEGKGRPYCLRKELPGDFAWGSFTRPEPRKKKRR